MDVTSPLVNSLLHWVAKVRAGPPNIMNEGRPKDELSLFRAQVPFTWPQDLEVMARSDKQLALWDDRNWPVPSLSSDPPYYLPLVCASHNYNISEYSTKLPSYLLLSPARIACWHSHLSVIHKHANSIPADDGRVAIIFEDDIDMELDIQKQLVSLWSSLPNDWDVVFLGYCWSNETYNPPLGAHGQFPLPSYQNARTQKYRLHNSKSPKCTHAYALSRLGARRLLLHLRHPPFAYSRAIDQAISWLVESGRLKSFSIVPSLVIQRKVTESDIMAGKGRRLEQTDIYGPGPFLEIGVIPFIVQDTDAQYDARLISLFSQDLISPTRTSVSWFEVKQYKNVVILWDTSPSVFAAFENLMEDFLSVFLPSSLG
ncbi:hypothetical protein CVT24_010848 [Panaeolus cyanescens]|uniref:Glycosyl transferase family 25 domain-containing protein n=1 Tax=Panaeolus cyanescens TaxID=181874 RepID=A0A409YYI9_9AGAR|nr:hypothetical protein CVT24_010848 [Panaeolus cyanescens]